MTVKVPAAACAAALSVCAALAPLWPWGRAEAPADLAALAGAAEAAGWRVVPAAPSSNTLAGGFYAVPPGDARGWEELARLRPGGGPGWRGAVLCLPAPRLAVPTDPPAYAGPSYMLYGHGPDVRSFAQACGFH